MLAIFSRGAGLRLVLILSCICLPALPAFAQATAGQTQTEPIDELRALQEPPGPPVAKGAAAITQQDAKCSTRIIVNADALFKPGRWTLNPDGAETMGALAPLVVKAGKHPVRIEAFVVLPPRSTRIKLWPSGVPSPCAAGSETMVTFPWTPPSKASANTSRILPLQPLRKLPTRETPLTRPPLPISLAAH